MADAVGPNISPELSKLLSSGDQCMRRLQSTKAVVSYCKAYYWDPCFTRTHLTTLSPTALETLISAMEDYCVCGFDTSERVPLFGVALSLEQLCDWITSPDMNPRSLIAWSLKVNAQMQSKGYVQVVKTCSEALSVFSFSETSFLVQRALAYLCLRQNSAALDDYLTAFEGNPKAAKAYTLEMHAANISKLLDLFYQEIKRLSNAKSASEDSSDNTLIKLFRFVLMVNPSDLKTYPKCAELLMKTNRHKEAASLLSEAINRTECDMKRLSVILQRAQCYLEARELDLALSDYMAASNLRKVATRTFILSLTQSNQTALYEHARKVSDDLLAQVRPESTPARDIQLSRALETNHLLHLLNPNDIDVLLSMAQCLVLQGDVLGTAQVYSEAISLNPSNCQSARIYRERASCHLQLNDIDNALEDYDAALCLEPNHAHTICSRMKSLLSDHQPEKGVLDMAKAAKNGIQVVVDFVNKLPSREREIVRFQMRLYLSNALQNSNLDKCNKYLLELVGKVLTSCFVEDLDCHLAYMDVLLPLNKKDEAQSILVRFIGNNPNDYISRVHLAVLKINLGKTLMGLEELCSVVESVEQEKLAEAFQNISANDKMLVARKAYVEAATNPFNDNSIILYTIAIAAANPIHCHTVYFLRGQLYCSMKKLDLALEDFTKALNINPNHIQSYLSRAIILLKYANFKESLSDLETALRLDQTLLTSLIQSLPFKTKKAILKVLFKCLLKCFAMFNLKLILPLSILLVESDDSMAEHHEVLGHAYLLFGKFGEAVKELEIAERCSRVLNTRAIGLLGLAHIMVNDFALGTKCFSRISEIVPNQLDYYVMSVLNTIQRAAVAQNASVCAQRFAQSFQYEQALMFWSVAIIARDLQKDDYLRKRCECLRYLQNYPRAMDDISDVINHGTPVIGDYCMRTSLRVKNGNLTGSCADLMKALDMGLQQTLDTMNKFFNEVDTDSLFFELASSQCYSKRYFEALNTCNYGLKINRYNEDLQALKLRLDSGKTICSIQ